MTSGSKCPKPPKPKNGKARLITRGGKTFARFTCRDRYKMVGFGIMRCRRGAWTPGSPPRCVLDTGRSGNENSTVGLGNSIEATIWWLGSYYPGRNSLEGSENASRNTCSACLILFHSTISRPQIQLGAPSRTTSRAVLEHTMLNERRESL